MCVWVCVRVCFRQGCYVRSRAVKVGVNSKFGNSTRQNNATNPLTRWGPRWDKRQAWWPPARGTFVLCIEWYRASGDGTLVLEGLWFLQIYATNCVLMVFSTCSQNVCCVMWSEVLLKFILKDKSSLVSLEGNRSSISKTFKGQDHIFYSVFKWGHFWNCFQSWGCSVAAVLVGHVVPPPPRLRSASTL